MHIAPQVYLIKCGEYIKIGITKNSVNSRVSSMQTGNPYPIEHVFSICTPKYKEVEAELHDIYKNKRYQGEWFLLSDDDILELETAIDRVIPTYEPID
jgi:hypothetical protein